MSYIGISKQLEVMEQVICWAERANLRLLRDPNMDLAEDPDLSKITQGIAAVAAGEKEAVSRTVVRQFCALSHFSGFAPLCTSGKALILTALKDRR